MSRDQTQVRAALEPYDLLFCLGADVLRMSVYSPVEPLPDGMPIVQIGIRDWEMGKNYPAEIALRCDVRETLQALLPILETKLESNRSNPPSRDFTSDNWTARRKALREKTLKSASRTPVDPAVLMLHVVEALPEHAVVVDEGILSTRALHAFLPFRDPSCFFGLASGGIGFALPGAIGIQLAQPERPVVAIVGDGSAMYSIQALWTAAHLGLPITYVICNNASYRIIKERLRTFHGSNQFIGMDLSDPFIDFVGLAESMGVRARRITEPADISEAIRETTTSGVPNLLDVVVDDGFNN